MELGVPHNVRFHADDAGRMGLTNDGTTAHGVAHEASSNMNMATDVYKFYEAGKIEIFFVFIIRVIQTFTHVRNDISLLC